VFGLQTQPAEPLAVHGLHDEFESVYFPGFKLRVEEIFRK